MCEAVPTSQVIGRMSHTRPVNADLPLGYHRSDDVLLDATEVTINLPLRSSKPRFFMLGERCIINAIDRILASALFSDERRVTETIDCQSKAARARCRFLALRQAISLSDLSRELSQILNRLMAS